MSKHLDYLGIVSGLAEPVVAKYKGKRYTRLDTTLIQEENGITNLLSTGTRIQRGDDIVQERNVKLSREIQQCL